MKMRTTSVIAIFLLTLTVVAGVTQVSQGANPTSVASSLSVSVVPPTLPADGRTHSVGVVSLLDSKGRQTVALNDTLVYLTSSQEDVGTIQSSVTIHAGQSYAVANATVTLTPGVTTITASSVGLTSGYADLKTMIPSGFPKSLAVFGAPPVQPLGQFDGKIVVEVLDQLGRPTRTASPTPILLTSSNNRVARPVVSNFTMPVDETLATVRYISNQNGPAAGPATITASATGFNAGYAQITISQSSGSAPVGLALQPDPSVLIADGRTYSTLTVMLRDVNTSATVSPPSGGVYVQLTSSQPSILTVPPVVLIPSGRSYVLVNATSTVSPGSSTITATSIGLASASAMVKTVTPAPSKLALHVAPQQAIVTSRGSMALLYVQLQDGDGNPALGRRETNIVITSSNISLTGSAIRLSIPRGDDYGVARLDLSRASEGVLTAASAGLKSSNASLSSFVAPLQASLASNSPSIYANQTVKVTLTAYGLGVPLKGASVTWSSTGGVVAADSDLTDPSGRATALFRPSSVGDAVVTATVTSNALGSANLTASVLVRPVPVQHQPSLLERVISYWLYIVPAAAAAAVAVIFVLRRRRKKEEPTEEGFELSS